VVVTGQPLEPGVARFVVADPSPIEVRAPPATLRASAWSEPSPRARPTRTSGSSTRTATIVSPAASDRSQSKEEITVVLADGHRSAAVDRRRPRPRVSSTSRAGRCVEIALARWSRLRSSSRPGPSRAKGNRPRIDRRANRSRARSADARPFEEVAHAR
jgi:hypothetical protein